MGGRVQVRRWGGRFGGQAEVKLINKPLSPLKRERPTPGLSALRHQTCSPGHSASSACHTAPAGRLHNWGQR